MDGALTFSAFDGLPSKGGFKAENRRALDELFARPGAFEAVAEETRIVYGANRQIIVALEERRERVSEGRSAGLPRPCIDAPLTSRAHDHEPPATSPTSCSHDPEGIRISRDSPTHG